MVLNLKNVVTWCFHFSYRCCKSVDLLLFSVFVCLYADVEFNEGELHLTPLIPRISPASLYNPAQSKHLLKCKADLVCCFVCWHVCKITALTRKHVHFCSRFKPHKVNVIEVSSVLLHNDLLQVCFWGGFI